MIDWAHRYGSERWLILLAFGCIYFIWGSTYLAIRFAVETLPPFMMVMGRCLVAGGVLYAWARLTGAQRPTPSHWARGVLTGGLLFGGGQAVLAGVERTVDSGLAALVLATIPVWMIVLQLSSQRPTARTIAGVVLGLGGVAILVTPGSGVAAVDPLSGALLLLCSLSWAIGSLVSRSGLPSSSALSTALQLLGGSLVSGLISLASGELGELNVAILTPKSLFAFAYLTVFGTLVTFTAYSWLLGRCDAAAVGSYAFVNPVVAVLVGWAFGGEALSVIMIVAAVVIVAGVYLVVTSKRERQPVVPEEAPEACSS